MTETHRSTAVGEEAAAGETPSAGQAAAGETPSAGQAAAGDTPPGRPAAAGETPSAGPAASGDTPVREDDATRRSPIEDRVAALESLIEDTRRRARRAEARGAVENVFSTYMYLHNAFRDEEIIDLWVKPGTPGVHAQYSNLGVYTTWESVTAYHRDRPSPAGKLLLHYTTTPVIEVAEDGETAKGVWVMNGLESGLTDPDVAGNVPDFFFEPNDVLGKKVWAHWVWCEYGVDFLRQDGEWKIWHFRCFEIARATFSRNWIEFASLDAASFDNDLMYFGEDGRPKFMPKPDAPATDLAQRYHPTRSQELKPRPPLPYRTFAETFEY